MRYRKMLESGIDPATVRFEVGKKNPYCKYSNIFVWELVSLAANVLFTALIA